jgi:hypothetical protein
MTVPVGYVGLPSSHPDYGKHYDDIPVDAYGGLGYAGEWEDQNDRLWYVGFDAGHSWDYDFSPFTSSSLNPYSNMISNKSLEFIIEETEKLAKQLAERKEDKKWTVYYATKIKPLTIPLILIVMTVPNTGKRRKIKNDFL